jgi:hypothetical protein
MMLTRFQSDSRLAGKLALAALWGIALYALVDLVWNFLPPHYSSLANPRAIMPLDPTAS